MALVGNEISADDFLNKLKSALRKDGDFPASAKVVGELKNLAANPNATADQITEIILREPSLSIRILHVVNSSFYRRAQPIMTVSQAVIKMGMKPLADMCSGLILLQKFVPAARQNTPFANCLKKCIVASILTGTITPQLDTQAQKNEETGFLAGSFSQMGTLLLAYYFPKIYENALKRADTKRIPLGHAIQQLTGLTPIEISNEVILALNLPQFYSEAMKLAAKPGNLPKNTTTLSPEKRHLVNVARGIASADHLADVITDGKGQVTLEKTVAQIQETYGIDAKALSTALGGLHDLFKDHCASMQLTLPELPDYIQSYGPDGGFEPKPTSSEELFMQFLDEIKQAVEGREPTASIIVTVMEAIATSLHFDLVLLMLATAGKQSMAGRMLIGDIPNFEPTRYLRPVDHLADISSPEVSAFKNGRCVFSGKALLKSGFPLVALPIGYGNRAVGVVYAERTHGNGDPLTIEEEDSLRQLSDLLDRSLSLAREGK